MPSSTAPLLENSTGTFSSVNAPCSWPKQNAYTALDAITMRFLRATTRSIASMACSAELCGLTTGLRSFVRDAFALRPGSWASAGGGGLECARVLCGFGPRGVCLCQQKRRYDRETCGNCRSQGPHGEADDRSAQPAYDHVNAKRAQGQRGASLCNGVEPQRHECAFADADHDDERKAGRIAWREDDADRIESGRDGACHSDEGGQGLSMPARTCLVPVFSRQEKNEQECDCYGGIKRELPFEGVTGASRRIAENRRKQDKVMPCKRESEPHIPHHVHNLARLIVRLAVRVRGPWIVHCPPPKHDGFQKI